MDRVKCNSCDSEAQNYLRLSFEDDDLYYALCHKHNDYWFYDDILTKVTKEEYVLNRIKLRL